MTPCSRRKRPAAGLRARLEHREQEVLDRDVLVLQPLGLLLGGVEQLAERARHAHVARSGARAADARPALEVRLDVRRAARPTSTSGALEQARHEAVRLVEQRQQQVLDVDLGVPEAQRLRLRVVRGPPGTSGSGGSGSMASPRAGCRGS